MRLENFLFENDNVYWTKQKDIDKIHANCSDIVKIYKKTNKFFYRGLLKWVDNEKMIKKKPRLRRKPKDMDQHMQKLFDAYFYEKFGWMPRSQGVFATTSYITSIDYGNPHVIFPFDGFEYIWSAKIADMYSEIGSPYERYGDPSSYIQKYGPDSKGGYWKKGNKIVKKTKDIDGFVDYEEEFDFASLEEFNNMVYTIEINTNTKDVKYEKWKWIPEITYDEFLLNLLSKKLETYKNTGIVQCLSKENEIMFKCKNYYAIPVNNSLSPRYFGL